MGSHPLNLALRFILELSALAAMGYWGYKQTDTGIRFIWAIGIPVLFAAVWVIFNVPGDPSRSGKAPVVVTGYVRLLIELFFFATASVAIYKTGYEKTGLIFGAVVLLHYALSYDRISWLFKN